MLHSERFVDQSPAEVQATLLEEQTYLCSTRTMYRILAAAEEVRERRAQARHPAYAKPALVATAPNQIWSWDITKLKGPIPYLSDSLYVILDLFSRYVVGWMVAAHENAHLAQRLIEATCRKQHIGPQQLTIHADRGAYHWQHEPAWFAVRQGRAAPWYGGRAQSTVWEVPNLNAIGGSRTGANTPTGHATQKPVRVFEIPILNHTTTQDAVYDPFVGSGTTLIAGEKLGRPTYAMDVDPIYVEVARRRWEAFTGQTAVRLTPERAPARRRRRAR